MSYINAITKREEDQVWVWERVDGKRLLTKYRIPYYFYTKDDTGSHLSIFNDKLKKHEFRNKFEYFKAKEHFENKREPLFESDIPPEAKILSKYYYKKPAPKLNVTFLDIEVDFNKNIGFPSIANPYGKIIAVALYHQWQNFIIVYTVPPDGVIPDTNAFIKQMESGVPLPKDGTFDIVFCKDEKELLKYLVEEIQESDIVSGWNSGYYDIPYIQKRLEKAHTGEAADKDWLCFPGAGEPEWDEVPGLGGRPQQKLMLKGRQELDYLLLYRKYTVVEKDSYKLESIAEIELHDLPKLEYTGTLSELYRNDYAFFIRYNIRDVEILKGFEQKLGFMALANEIVHLTTSAFKSVTGVLKVTEAAIINYCHYDLNRIVPNKTELTQTSFTSPPDDEGGEQLKFQLRITSEKKDKKEPRIKGAYVLEPKVGMYEWIGGIDIKSLYPSTIRAINISPETIIGQFQEKEFAARNIAAGWTDTELILSYDSQRDNDIKTAKDWKQFLLDKKWAVSGYGTVYDQSKDGIIPSILKMWYATRKQYQKQAKEATDVETGRYFDRLQYVYKIMLNAAYGAMSNPYFKFFDLRAGESVTGTGRLVLKHQCAEANRLLTGVYDTLGEAIIYGDSVANDSVIITPEGRCSIEQTFVTCDSVRGTKEYHQPTNLQVLTYDESTNTTCFKKVNYVMRHKVNKQMYRVWISNQNYIDVTEDHSLIGYRNSNIWKLGESRLTEIKALNNNKNVRNLIHLKKIPRENIRTKGYSKETYEILGYILGDGYGEKTVNGGVGLSIGKQDLEEVVEKLLVPLQKQKVLTSWIYSKNGHDVRICGAKLWHIVHENLYTTNQKQIPDWLFEETEENICSFLRGYFSADGSASLYGGVALGSVKREFIQETQELLFYCGIASNFFKESSENHYLGKYSGTYTFVLHVKGGPSFAEKIGFIQSRKQERIKKQYGISRKYIHQYDYEITRVTKVENICYDNYVYDIQVDDTHTFFANNILVHNTDSTYFSTSAQDKAEAIQVANAIGEGVNASFQRYMRDTFLCNLGFDSVIETSRELVADRGIFVDKKRYVLHIVDKEGKTPKPDDEIKMMGLDIKKTTLPKQIAKKLFTFIKRLLEGDSWNVIAEDIITLKEEILTTADFMSMGLPKGLSAELDVYTQAYEEAKEKKRLPGQEVKVRLPGHVAAAIMWNIQLKVHNDHVSTQIVRGTKLKVYYLTQRFLDKFKSIAVPVDIEQPPQWFIDEFYPIIDREAHAERLVDNPLNNILKAINKESPSKQSLFADNLLGF